MPAATPRLRVALPWLTTAVLGALVLTGCDSDEPQAAPPRGIVLNLGGSIGVLDEIDSPVKIAAKRPAGAEPDEDIYTLNEQSQLSSGEIVGIDDGTLVSLDPARPERATVLGPAVTWFPSRQGHKAWAVTEQPAATACAGETLPASVTARYAVRQHDLSGRPGPAGHTLPCGIRPLADSTQGVIGLLTTADEPGTGNAKKARTDVVLLDGKTHLLIRTLAENASVVSTGPSRVIWRQADCDKSGCVTAYDTTADKNTSLPDCAVGTPAGRGVISADGRWYATVLNTTTAVNHLAVLDLAEGHCKDLGRQANLTEADLDGPLKVAWSKTNLLVLDTTNGALTNFDAVSGEQTDRTSNLSITGTAQIWGTRLNRSGPARSW
ncbi:MULTISPECIES: hypothetical protein [unclassified Streptomyces]|uniref:hypothetical protein n=1 Tax=unclassified Streptomyces TaxID=2593676 RepID=UPI0006AEB00C|nr:MULTISPECIES: hypothetical protein [unclassified Streptomyces]KOX36445.1 hypothetical protein ADL06_04830 [Streptomyces sp. NRRL F-6491]KOX51326.1 hypothetical protein ADL08_04525 [Streptomyces sp. NRRL F-6492]